RWSGRLVHLLFGLMGGRDVHPTCEMALWAKALRPRENRSRIPEFSRAFWQKDPILLQQS
ncbi:hypothetical protein, partial [Roseibacillus persicicus]|uniref:hypothetical protein n=1 Tax=Roseibacillus persicicus TaxID=454148 RepID=UPI00280D6599